MLAVADRVLRLAGRPELTVVEAGSGKGGSTAKLSLVDPASPAAGSSSSTRSAASRPTAEVHRNLYGRRVEFRAGAFRGRLPSVRRTVARFGALEVCEFRKGWFADTLPAFDGHVDVALLDVDLLSSTRTCLTHLMPRLRPGGVIFTQDGHLHAIVDLLADPPSGATRSASSRRRIRGLGREKLLAIPAPRAERRGCGSGGEDFASALAPDRAQLMSDRFVGRFARRSVLAPAPALDRRCAARRNRQRSVASGARSRRRSMRRVGDVGVASPQPLARAALSSSDGAARPARLRRGPRA